MAITLNFSFVVLRFFFSSLVGEGTSYFSTWFQAISKQFLNQTISLIARLKLHNLLFAFFPEIVIFIHAFVTL